MKIWVVGRNYPDKNNNRQGSFELEQAKMLAKRGNDVTYIACVLHPFWRIKKSGYVEFKDDPVSVYAYSGFFTPHMTSPLIQAPYFPKIRNKKWKGLLDRVEKNKGLPDVIHIHFPLMVLAAEVFEEYWRRGVKVVVTEHWTKVINKQLDHYELNQMNAYLSFVDAYMAVGYSLKRAIEETTAVKREIIVMPNIINDVFRPTTEEHSDFIFGIVGRLATEKQMDKIIEAFANNFRGKKKINLVIVGNGGERAKLEKIVETFGIKGQVDFKGSLDREDTAAVVKNIDCLVCFSRYETFGVPIIEAWACGVPVITTTADCITDCWDNRLGITVDYRDVGALETAMCHMVDNIKNYDHELISKYALSRYSEESIYKKLMVIYKA